MKVATHMFKSKGSAMDPQSVLFAVVLSLLEKRTKMGITRATATGNGRVAAVFFLGLSIDGGSLA